jgi:hypothetical protein
MFIENAGQLKAFLSDVPDETEIRTVFDAVGAYFYPHIYPELKLNTKNGKLAIIFGPCGDQSLHDIRIEMRTPEPKNRPKQ